MAEVQPEKTNLARGVAGGKIRDELGVQQNMCNVFRSNKPPIVHIGWGTNGDRERGTRTAQPHPDRGVLWPINSPAN